MNTDVAVVGAGIVGLATARSLQQAAPGTRVIVLEAGAAIAGAQTAHNSGVIHTGVYYTPGSLKARFCTEGAAAMREFCALHAIPLHRCGKLIVATDPRELARLDELERRGHANGVPGLTRLSSSELREREPAVRGLAALWSPEASVVDFQRVAQALATEIRAVGGQIETGWPVHHVAVSGDAATLVAADGRRLTAARVISCAGADAARLAEQSGAPADPRIVPFRGSYLHLRPERAALVQAMIYPVPDPALPFLGVHLTPTIDGGLTLGPTALLAPHGLPEWRRTLVWPGTARMVWRQRRSVLHELQMAVSRRAVIRAAQRYVPALQAADVAPTTSFGVRAQAVARDGTLVEDFATWADGPVLHVRNAPSPAATSALAIGRALAAS